MKVAVGASSFAQSSERALNYLEEHGVEVVKNPFGRKLTMEETIAHLQGADGLLAGLEALNEEIFAHTPDLKAIARIGIGMDNVDIPAAKKRGIKVSNTPDAPTEAVAEMAMAALLAIAHEIIPANEDMHKGVWKKRIGFSLIGLNVLFIGYGRIGRRFARHLKALGSNILVYDPFLPDLSQGTLEELLGQADVITLHASGTEEILTDYMFQYMRHGVTILNCARGSLISEQALYQGLKSGNVGHYWGDVFEEEPYRGILISCDNALLTPHISTYNSLCRESMELEAAKNILEDLGCV